MSFTNHVQLVGRAGSDATSCLLSDGSRIVRLRLYQPPSRHTTEVEPDYFYLVAWDGIARQLEAQVKRGNRLLVHGRLTNRRWEQEGIMRTRTEVHLSHFVRLKPATKNDLAISSSHQLLP